MRMGIESSPFEHSPRKYAQCATAPSAHYCSALPCTARKTALLLQGRFCNTKEFQMKINVNVFCSRIGNNLRKVSFVVKEKVSGHEIINWPETKKSSHWYVTTITIVPRILLTN